MLTPEQIFCKYDVNGDGVLQKEEFARVVDDLFGVLREEDIKALLDSVDADGSGEVGLVELKAFLRMCSTETKTLHTKSALIIIDVQNDFISGTLANADPTTTDIVLLINQLRSSMDVVVVSQDWHPHDHCSFVESANDGATPIVTPAAPYDPFALVTLAADADRPEHVQCVFARHAVQGTWGAENHADLVVSPTDGRIYKGQKPNIDSYSAFYDNMKLNDCGLLGYLEEQGVTHCYCVGLVFDICVKSTALHGAEAGFQMYVVEDACRPLNPSEVESTKAQLAAAGVKLTSAAEAAERARATKGQEVSLAEYVAMANGMKAATRIEKESAASPLARTPATQRLPAEASPPPPAPLQAVPPLDEYMKQHIPGIESEIDQFLIALLTTRPENPTKYMAEYFSKRTVEAPAASDASPSGHSHMPFTHAMTGIGAVPLAPP